MAKRGEINVKDIIHPGFILGMELKSRNLTQKNFAAQIATQQSHLSEIIKGKRNITDQLAKKLEDALSIPAEHWIRMQAEYGYKIKAANLKNTEERDANALLSEYNVIYDMKAIFKAAGIALKSASEKLKFCLEVLLFGTPAVQRRQLQGCYHRSEKTGLDPRMIATWSVIAKYEASRKPNPTSRFDKNRLDALAEELRDIFNDNHNTMNRVERTLSDYGIKFCIVPKVKHASVDGYSFFTDGVPAIVITQRFNRIDNVAFAVMHEVGHIKLHASEDGKGKINLPYYDAETIPTEEIEANDFAAHALIPQNKWVSLPDMPLNPRSIQRLCTKWAKENGINKWIVLGRVSHETGMYMFKSDSSREVN
ncbi:MAG: ImmA/IrrE family metallo-endopeptidase [Bacteroidaceae bacterium]|nr:ImmA/IrrE family metallo-endopeptidase [Bacteroidaceae bacterium]